MTVSILSYNLLFNKALNSIGNILKGTDPDIVCLQEMETSEENIALLKVHGYTLADFSNSFIKFGRVFGQATFYKKGAVNFVGSDVLNLPRSYYEVILLILRGANEPRTVVKTEFKKSNTRFIVYNLHLSSYQATNRARARQIEKTFEDLDLNARNVVITGDFNYPFGRKKFEQLIAQFSLKEATSNLYFTSVFRFLKLIPIRFKVDYILYRGLKLKKTDRIQPTYSDHYPILSEFIS